MMRKLKQIHPWVFVITTFFYFAVVQLFVTMWSNRGILGYVNVILYCIVSIISILLLRWTQRQSE
ncbi:hypothetical protein KDA_07930 [Dictyobacter alpinus]|uniref:Uncharacterized protein n=1 Tax=Dictyobacter alpinus TaxID=2014873 RepID=A0A402B1T4_9CHLR|nr:hypothetical protein KDA_07930 [Dictyobacter alpinus]